MARASQPYMSSSTRQYFAERKMLQLYRTMISIYHQMNMAARLRTQKHGKAKGRGPEKDSGPDTRSIMIPVMGLSGVGKSTFINAVLGKETMPVGHDMDPCTVDITSVDIGELGSLFPNSDLSNHGRHILLVDTPGFDDNACEDGLIILERLANWLKDLSHNNVLGGVIYLHDISIDRYTGSAKKNLKVFRRFYGDDALHTVVLGTTKSSRLNEEEAVGRLTRLKDPHWKDMVEKGASVVPFEGDQKSALELVRKVLRGFKTDVDSKVKESERDRLEPDASDHTRAETPPDAIGGPVAQERGRPAHARYSFDGTGEGELSISSGAEVEVLDDQDPGWWYVRDVRTGQEGTVPAAYLL